MDVKYDKKTNSLIVTIQGDFDHHSSKRIRELIERNMRKFHAKNLVLDFKGLSFMDSSGIGVIIGRYRDISINGGKIVIVNVNNQFKRIFNISGIQKIIDIYDDTEKALKHM
ncbi:MAG: anti-sigma F factor antagonist [Clostridia bacterium]|nr:anti-sigma F factor antagonist [Clostridia bacterium]